LRWCGGYRGWEDSKWVEGEEEQLCSVEHTHTHTEPLTHTKAVAGIALWPLNQS